MFDNPYFSCQPTGSASYYYNTHTLTHTGGFLTANLNNTNPNPNPNIDPVLVLYSPPFDPAQPCSNLIAVNDDGGVYLDAFLSRSLPAGTYVAVATTFSPGRTGTYQLTSNARLSTADLSITKTDGVTSATPGDSVTYTITATNAGPDAAMGATVADALPATLTGTWTCVGAGGGSCTATGAGSINDTVNLPVGASVTYTVSAAISAAASGSLINTATISAPAGVTDPDPANNSATDTDTLAAVADLAISTTGSAASATPGGVASYVVTASNTGPSDATAAAITFAPPSGWATAWTCAGTGGGTCAAAGNDAINASVNLPAGASVTYTVTAQVPLTASGTRTSAAGIAAAVDVTDPTPGNNSASHSVQVQAGLAVATASLPDGQIQQAYATTTLAATGGTGTLQWVATSALPTGLLLSSSGVLTGTPTQAGSFSVEVKVTDSGTPTPQIATQTLALSIAAADLTIATPAALPPATAGQAYSVSIAVQGGEAPYRFSVTAGTLPAGLALDGATGAITGTPTLTGDASFSITEDDNTVPKAASTSANAKRAKGAKAAVVSVTQAFSLSVAPAAVAATPTPVPTLHHAALALLSLMAAAFGGLALRWKKTV